MSVNTQTLLGNVGKAPVESFINGKTPKLSFSVATSERWKDRATGEWKEQTTWHNCECLGMLAEVNRTRLHKGAQVFIMGTTRHDKWKAANGETKYWTKVLVNKVEVVGTKAEESQTTEEPASDLTSEGVPF